jgi:hypothetical protein
MTKKGNTCVEKEKKHRVTPGDVIRVLPGLIGPGRGGGGGNGGGAGPTRGRVSPGKP